MQNRQNQTETNYLVRKHGNHGGITGSGVKQCMTQHNDL